MIRMGRYDVFDKLDIVCRSWMGQQQGTEVGMDRHGRELLPLWKSAAGFGGERECRDYLELRHQAIQSGQVAAAAPDADLNSDLHEQLSQLLNEVGYNEVRRRVYGLTDSIKLLGLKDATVDDLSPEMSDRFKEIFKSGALRALRWTDDFGEIPDLDALRAQGRPFPVDAVKGKRKILAMFCVRFYGMIDVIHLYDVCPDHVTLVDLDTKCLEAVQEIYPPEWDYINADYKEFLSQAVEQDYRYDLVVADPWRAQCPEVGFDMLPVIMGRTDVYIAHYVKEMFDELGVGLEDLDALSAAIRRRTGVDVVVTETVERSVENCWAVIRKA